MIYNVIFGSNDGQVVNMVQATEDVIGVLKKQYQYYKYYTDLSIDYTKFYFNLDNELVAKPDRPNNYSKFNYSTKTWVDDNQLLQAQLNSTRRLARAAKINEGFQFSGTIFQIDDTSRSNIMGKVAYLQLNHNTDQVSWKATDNTIKVFTRDEFFEFASQVSDYYEDIILSSNI